MILRFGCPRPSALLIHTHALFTLGASGCHLGHNSHLFHLTARCATHSCIWTREGMARTAPSRQRPAPDSEQKGEELQKEEQEEEKELYGRGRDVIR